MKLQDFADAQHRYNTLQIEEDAELSRDIKEHLAAIGLLESVSENSFDAVAIAALKRFQHDYDCHEPNIIGPETAAKLIEAASSGSRSLAKPLVIKTNKETLFKQLPLSVDDQTEEEMKTFGAPKDKALDITFYEKIRGHLRVTLTAPLGGLYVWYVLEEDVVIVADDPSGGEVVHSAQLPPAVKLDIPYKSQLDNLNHPTGTCNVTCMAMCMEYVKPELKPSDGTQLEDKLYRYAINNGLDFHSPQALAKIAEKHGVKDDFDSNASIKKVKAWLAAGLPAVTHGFFPHTSGHIIVLAGYDDKGFIVHDPNGEWFSWGYDRNDFTGNNEKGKFKNYSYGLIKRTCILDNDPNGRFWVHFISA